MLPTWLSFPLLLLPYRINVGSLGSLIPYSVNGPFKRTLMSLFRLAWSNKLQLPILITVCFMAFDIRLQLEINIFWEANHQNGRNRQANVNAQVMVPPVVDTHANEGENNSTNDSDEEDETDSDESELQSLKDNNDSDDTEDEGDSERPNPQSRFFSDSDHNFSDRHSNEESDDSDGNDGNPPIVVEVEIHRANKPSTCHGLCEAIELNSLCYKYKNDNSEISVFDTRMRQTVYKAFAKSTMMDVAKRVLTVPFPLEFKTKLLPNIVNAQNCWKKTGINCLHNPAKNFRLLRASNFVPLLSEN